MIASAQPSVAAERLFFTYGPLGRSIPIEDLRTFADTGETTSQIRWYLRLTDLDPEILRAVLNQELVLNINTVDSITYSLPGEYALFEIGQLVHTQSRQANIQALRGALLVSLSEDNRISLIEFLENYPTPGIYVDGVVLAEVARDVGNFVDRLQPAFIAIEEFLSGLLCDCQTIQSPLEQSSPEQSSPEQSPLPEQTPAQEPAPSTAPPSEPASPNSSPER
ncbi:MAG: hypothetical protein Kow00121_40150 [Elainellaceae cyanobacterium]